MQAHYAASLLLKPGHQYIVKMQPSHKHDMEELALMVFLTSDKHSTPGKSYPGRHM